MDMKKYISVCVVPLFLCLGCTPQGNLEDDEQKEETTECQLVDLSDVTDDYDELIIKDNSHVVLKSHFDNGFVRDFLIINEQDTLAVVFREDGFPEFITDGHSIVVFGDYSENSVLVGLINENGEYEVADIETEQNWIDYQRELAGLSTKVDNRKENLIEHTQSYVVNDILYKIIEKKSGLSPGALSPVSLITWFLYAIEYSLVDNPTYQKCISYLSMGTDMYFDWTYGFYVAGVTGGALVVANGLIWRHNINLISQGIRNGDFRSLKVQEPEMFAKELEGGFWFRTASSAVIDWQAQQLNAVIRLGIANFDLNTEGAIEIGVKKGITLPEGWTADVVGQGKDYALIVSVSPNTTDGIITASIPVYLAGVYNVQDDLLYEIQQTPQIQFDPNPVCFESLTPITVTVTSLSKEKWDVEAWPEWLDYSINRIETQAVNSITLTPRYLDGANEGNVVFAVTTSDGNSSYTKYLPVHPKRSDPFIYMDRVLCPDQNHPHAIDLGLSVKWACCDVGASTPLEHGSYFAWGEVETKEYISDQYYHPVTYTINDYKWYKEENLPGVGMLRGYTRYNSNPKFGFDGFTDDKTTLNLEDDAAHVNWGGGWRMPTKEELDELNRECSWYNNHGLSSGGGLATGPSGNSIYMKNKGCYGPTSYYTYGWYHANYWTSSLETELMSNYAQKAWGVVLDNRYVGQAVRPVCD